MLGRCVFVCLVCVLGAFDEAAGAYRAVDRIIADGFPAETHNVTTPDGYRLEMHRIPHGREAASNAIDRPVVFLMHGLMSSSESFVLLGPELSFAYNLADAGFDVWMGNARGNTYSRSHVSLNPDSIIQKYSFFDFTFEEIGAIDLPTMMDYALEVTGKHKLHYIGHSQGGTAFLVLGALNSEYMNKITSAHLLAGVGYQEYFPNEPLAAAATNVDTIYTAARLIGIVELYPEFLESLMPRNGYTVADYCTGDVEQRYMCELFGVRHYVRQDSFGGLAGASLKQAAHYGQNIRDKLFRRYHHGSRNNQAAYGQEEPPLYDLSLITVDVTMHYTVNDNLLDERDVLAMAADMPNTRVRKVARETFLHEDFVVAPDAKELVTDYIIKKLKNTPADVEYIPRPVGSIEDKIVSDGFPLETHHVTTSDGYILGIHRIPHGRETDSSTTARPVVFLMHGLMSASESFVLLGPDHSLAYNLADAGFDVWMGNARGNRYSRSHVSLDPDSTIQKYSYFDFTFEEIGAIDLPTMMDYALEFTGQQKLQYIGHSQGGTAFLVLGALKSDYMNKIASAHLLAGVGYQEYFPNEQLAATAVNVDTIYNAARLLGIVELYPDFLEGLTPRDGYTVADYCTGNVEQSYMCELFGVRHLLRQDSLGSPAGASLKQAAHYGQNIRDKLFRRYHHGTANDQVFGLEEPPLYDLSLITADVTMHYTVNDNLLDERDVLAMAADMPNTKVRKVARETFSHGDFIVALDAKELVTDYIVEELKNTLDAVEEDDTPPAGSIEDRIVTDGFPLETHHVTTSDGYILGIHRIPHGRETDSSTTARPVVFLMHGLMSASESFVLLGPDHSLAYNLADAGFDVWMGNARGNRYSRSHVSLDPDSTIQKYSFFDFTFEEIGAIDLPTMMDYALEFTGQQKLQYIGHSQGGTAFLVLGALKSDYMNKIASVHLLAGVGYQEYFPNEQLAATAVNVDTIYNAARLLGIVELYPDFLEGLTPRDGYTVADYCTGNVEQRYMCELFGVRHLLRQDSLGSPAGASLKQAAHYGQNIRDKLFRRYHHGATNNQAAYGLEEPPLYDLSLITADVTMHYTVNDNLLDERDVLAMAADMPNTKVRKVARETFSHADFIVALDAKELVTDYIIEELKNTLDAIEEDNTPPAGSIEDRIVTDGFPLETHYVTTNDGYRLMMHRISHGRETDSSTIAGPLVFLMHGLMSSSEAFILLGPDHSVAYNLADSGFDVWMGNARGNRYSRSHASLDPDHNTEKYDFFDFTYEEIGAIDLPTMMDYALEVTGKQKLHYIGHSQGGTAFLVLGALNSEYMKKIASAHLLAGVGYQEYFPNEPLAAAATNVDIIYNTALRMGIVELYPEFLDGLTPRNGYTVADYCTGRVEQRHMCELFGVRHFLRQDNLGSPAGASLKQAAHYGQNIRDKLFRRYHHGTANDQVYGLEEPPLYDLSLITADVTMHYTVNDNLLDERDVLAMAADMPNTKVRKVARETFLHEDFVAAFDAKELVTDYIIEELKNTPDTVEEDNVAPALVSTPDKIVADGYPAETHHVTTMDGYILAMHRIPHGRQGDSNTVNKPVVFLMHGLMASSYSFVELGPEYSMAYNLADEGFDVWMGNARGNIYSRSHVSLDPDDDIEKFSFFDLTFEEIGLHDLPTMMDYALEVAGKQRLHYIGHSQGGTVFLVLGSLRSEYMIKIASAHLLAGVGYQDHFPNEELKAIADNVDDLYQWALMMGIVELYPNFLDLLPVTNGYSVADYCTGKVEQRYMCELLGVRHLLTDDDEAVVAGAALKQAVHFIQNIRDKYFRRFHHGTEDNQVVYGLEEPPLYDISYITADVTMHYTVNDNLLDERDVLAMAADIPNAKVRKVARETFLHEDFILAYDAKELVTDYIIEELKNTPDTLDEEDNTDIDDVNVIDHTDETDPPSLVTEAPIQTTTPDSAASIVLNFYLILLGLVLIFM